MRFPLRSTFAALALLAASGSAQALTLVFPLNAAIKFDTAGTVTLTLDFSSGGFDHILEMASVAGPVGTPVMALTNELDPSMSVLGFAPASVGDSVVLGSFAAGEELVFRLTNVGSHRFGTPGTIDGQIFTGTSSTLNPSPSDFYTNVTVIDATTTSVDWEDLIPVPPGDPDPLASFVGVAPHDVGFTLTLDPVPEPGTWAMLLAGLGMLGLIGRRRSRG
ncbi:MAG: hypothetical protein OHK0026_02860 [Rhodocyclaceae bacterium]